MKLPRSTSNVPASTLVVVVYRPRVPSAFSHRARARSTRAFRIYYYFRASPSAAVVVRASGTQSIHSRHHPTRADDRIPSIRFRFRPMRPSIETPFASVPMPCFFSSIIPRPASVSVSRARAHSFDHPSVASIHPSIHRSCRQRYRFGKIDGRTDGRTRPGPGRDVSSNAPRARRSNATDRDRRRVSRRACRDSPFPRRRLADANRRERTRGRRRCLARRCLARRCLARRCLARRAPSRTIERIYALDLDPSAPSADVALLGVPTHADASIDRSNERTRRTNRSNRRLEGRARRAKGAFGGRGGARHGPDAPTGVGGVATRRKV